MNRQSEIQLHLYEIPPPHHGYPTELIHKLTIWDPIVRRLNITEDQNWGPITLTHELIIWHSVEPKGKNSKMVYERILQNSQSPFFRFITAWFPGRPTKKNTKIFDIFLLIIHIAIHEQYYINNERVLI